MAGAEGRRGADLYQVLDVQPPKVLVLATLADPHKAWERGLPWSSWSFVLRDLGHGTRLIAWLRSDFKPTLAGLLVNKYALEPAHFVMERKVLLGIKRRTERAGTTR